MHILLLPHTGNCNGDSKDDFTTKNGMVTRDTDEFGKSWLYQLPSETGCNVISKPEECIPLPPDQDPCFKILDEERFGRVSHYIYVLQLATNILFRCVLGGKMVNHP
jgi:hypothetical protein